MSNRSSRPDPVLPGDVGSAVALAEFEERLPKRGRPAGSKNAEVDLADVELTACAKCSSTEREPYFNRRDLPIQGNHPKTGKPYTKIIVRRTRCLGCGQTRDDRHFVNEPRGRSSVA